MSSTAVAIPEASSAAGEEETGPLISILAQLLEPEIVDINIKHPLENRWVIWFDYPPNGGTQTKDYLGSLNKIYTIGTVEDFWSVFNNIADANIVPTGSTYHFFKEGINPMWEDPTNKLGGKWVLNTSKDQLAGMWENTLLAIIGEQFHPHGDQICGAVMAKRAKGDKISLWTKQFANKEACISIGHTLKRSLGIEPGVKIGYQAHEDAIRTNKSFTNADRYSIPEVPPRR